MTAFDQENDVTIKTAKLPGNIRAFSLCAECGRVVVLNDAMTDAAMRTSYRHELAHFERCDHDNQDYKEYA